MIGWLKMKTTTAATATALTALTMRQRSSSRCSSTVISPARALALGATSGVEPGASDGVGAS
ncbi:hypothetical protein D3C78_1893440 [compost metagenome]